METKEKILSELSKEALSAHAISIASDGDAGDTDLAGLKVLRDLDKGLIKPSEIVDALKSYEEKLEVAL